MNADNCSADFRQSTVPIVFWTLLLTVLFVSSLIRRSTDSAPRAISETAIDRLVEFDSIQFVTDFRSINS